MKSKISFDIDVKPVSSQEIEDFRKNMSNRGFQLLAFAVILFSVLDWVEFTGTLGKFLFYSLVIVDMISFTVCLSWMTYGGLDPIVGDQYITLLELSKNEQVKQYVKGVNAENRDVTKAELEIIQEYIKNINDKSGTDHSAVARERAKRAIREMA